MGGYEVFDVQHHDAIGVTLETGDRIAAAYDNPAAIHLEVDQSGIGEAYEMVEGDGAIRKGMKLFVVIVISEGHSGGLHFGGHLVEVVGVVFPVVKSVRALGLSVSRKLTG